MFSIREDGEGRLWLALWYYGLSLYDPVAGTFENHRLEDGRAYFVNADVPGKVYAGTWGGGLFELDQADGAVRRFTSDGERRWSLPHDTMYSIVITSYSIHYTKLYDGHPVLARQLLEHRYVGRVAGLRLLAGGQLALDEQDLLELLRRVHVELVADERNNFV